MSTEQIKQQGEDILALLRASTADGMWLNREAVATKPKRGERPFDTLMRVIHAENTATTPKEMTADESAKMSTDIHFLQKNIQSHLSPIFTDETGADYDVKKDVIMIPEESEYERPQEYLHDLLMAASLATGHPDRFDRAIELPEVQTEDSVENSYREQFLGELVAAELMSEYGVQAQIAPDSRTTLDEFERRFASQPEKMQSLINDFNHIIAAMRQIKHDRQPDYAKIADTQVSKDSEENANAPRLKTQTEQRAAKRQIELITTALEQSKEHNGVWMNPQGKMYPSFYPKGPAISPFNALNLALHSDANSYKTNLYTTFQEAKLRDEGVKASEKGVPFNWYNWSKYVNRNNPDEVIARKDYLALPKEDRSQYKGVQNREIRTLFNLDQTMTPEVDPDRYAKSIGWNGSEVDRSMSNEGSRAVLKAMVDVMLDNIDSNLVHVSKDASIPTANYDIRHDVVNAPNPGAYVRYEDFVHDVISQVVRATGHPERLAREGAVNRSSHDEMLREELTVELATGVKMLEMGLPARLPASVQGLVEDWSRQLREDPKMIDVLEGEVNNALEVIHKAEQGEKIEYSSMVNRQRARQLQEKQRPQVSVTESLVLADIIRHHGMDIPDGNFRNAEERTAFLEKFGMTYYIEQLQYAREQAKSEDPDLVETAYTEMYNHASNLDQLAREYRPADWNVKGRREVENMMLEMLDDDPKDMILIRDKETGAVDVVLPQGAFEGGKATMPDGQERSFYLYPEEVLSAEEKKDAKIQFNDASGFAKNRIEYALNNDPHFSPSFIRFFNKDGVAGFHADDRYFEGKEIFAARLNRWALDNMREVDIQDKVEKARDPQFEKVLMIKDDENRWMMFVQPQDEKPFGVFPDKADINKFFTAAHQGNPVVTAAVRQELAAKYYELSKVKPELKMNVLGEKASEEDAARLQRVNIFKNKQGQFMIMAKVTDTPKQTPAREITAAQWQRLWLSPDHDEYKKDLAAKIFADVLHPELHQKEDVEQKEDVKEEEAKVETKADATETLSPMLKQYIDSKKKHPDALLLFRCDDFYETYMQDAEKSSKILGITLTRSSKTQDPEGKPLAMAGFPYHALDTFLPKLIRAGERVAICDQIESPRQQAEQAPKEEEARSSHFHR